jgi:NADP oxidoreductase coenzyme F420-dependent
MNIGILGSGIVAQALGCGFLKHGYPTMLGTRETNKLAGWAKQNPNGRLGGFADAAKFGDVVVLAVKGLRAVEAVDATGAWGVLRPVAQLAAIFSYRNAHRFPGRVYLPGINQQLSPAGRLINEDSLKRPKEQASGFVAFVEKQR